MRRTLLLALFAVFAWASGLPPASAAAVSRPHGQKLKGGALKIFLDPAIRARMRRDGVRLQRQSMSTFGRGHDELLLRYVQGDADPSLEFGASASFGSGYQFAKGGARRVSWSPRFVFDRRRGVVTSGRRSVLTFDPRRARITREIPWRLVVDGFDVRLTGGFAAALNRRLGTRTFTGGQKLGAASVALRFQAVEMTGGTATMALADEFLPGGAFGVAPAGAGSLTANGRDLAVPLTAGRVTYGQRSIGALRPGDAIRSKFSVAAAGSLTFTGSGGSTTMLLPPSVQAFAQLALRQTGDKATIIGPTRLRWDAELAASDPKPLDDVAGHGVSDEASLRWRPRPLATGTIELDVR